MFRFCIPPAGLLVRRIAAPTATLALFFALITLASGTAHAQVRISEVLANPVGPDDTNQKIELTNYSDSVETIGGLRICNQFRYATIPAGVTLDPGESYIIHHRATGTNDDNNWYIVGTLQPLVVADDSYALYKAVGSFADPAVILDFVEWGAGNQPRENIAVGAGIWPVGQFTPVPAEGMSIQLCDPGGIGPTGWVIAAPTIGAANTCAVPKPQVILSEVLVDPVGGDSADQKIEIHNLDAATVDATDFSIAFQSQTWTFPAIMLNPGARVVLHLNRVGVNTATDLYTGPLAALQGADAVGLFLPVGGAGDYDDPDFILDFVQWGASGLPGEVVADAAGLWMAGDSLSAPGLGHSLERCVDSPGVASWNETPDQTFGADNSCNATDVVPPQGTPRVLFVGSPVPNPSWECSIVDFELSRPAHVMARVRDLRGRVIEVLANQAYTAGRQSIVWEGMDSHARIQRPGIYFLEIWSPDAVDSYGKPLRVVRRIVRLRH